MILGMGQLPLSARTNTPAPESFYVLVPKPTRRVVRTVKRVVPGAWIRQVEGRRFLQAGVYKSKTNAQTLIANLKRRGITAYLGATPVARYIAPQTNTPKTMISALSGLPPLPVSQDAALPVIAVASPTPYTPMTRLLVPAKIFYATPQLAVQIQGAFRREVEGKQYIQIGAFSQAENLNQMIQNLQTLGIDPMVQQPQW